MFKNHFGPTCIDLIIKNRPRYFKYSMMSEKCYQISTKCVIQSWKRIKRIKPSIFKYYKYKFFFNDAFLKDLLSKFGNEQNAPISSLKETVNRTLEKHGAFKKRYVRVNQIHFINKTYVNRVKKYQTYGCNKSQEENPVI